MVQSISLNKLSFLKFFAIFAIGLLLFYGVYYSIFFQDIVKPLIVNFQTSISGFLLQLFGFAVETNMDQLIGSNILVKVSGGCDGIEATALYLIALFLFPIPIKYKWSGLLWGLLVLTILNILRIIGLFLVAKYYPNNFEFMHTQGGLYLYSFITILLVLIWSDWALKNYQKELKNSTNRSV